MPDQFGPSRSRPPGLTKEQRTGAILGAADGLTIVVSFVFGRNPAIFHSALNAGIGEFVGMGAALWLTNPKARLAALLCGLCTLVACVLPSVPYIFLRGLPALCAALLVATSLSAIVCCIRPQKGWTAIAETFGVLALASVLCYATSFLF